MNIETTVDDAGGLTASRKGSPFAPGTAKPSEAVANAFNRLVAHQESLGEGVWRETAASATFASLMLLVFAASGTVYFPAGGLAIGLLGISMAMLGLSSRLKRLSMACLVMHFVLLGICYTSVI